MCELDTCMHTPVERSTLRTVSLSSSNPYISSRACFQPVICCTLASRVAMSNHPPLRPITYGDIFDHFRGELASEPITIEDASLMQSVETLGFGSTHNGGAASLMQAAADNNVNTGTVHPRAHSKAAEQGFTFKEGVVDGQIHDEQFIGDQSVASRTTFFPTLPEAAATKGVTIGGALKGAALNAGDKLVDVDTARAIQIAEAQATGHPLDYIGGLGATAQSAAQRNAQGEHHTLSEVLNDVTEKMLVDKVVTQKDVERVMHAEIRTSGGHTTSGENMEGAGVITHALQGAVNLNAEASRYMEDQQQQDLKAKTGHLD